MARASGRRLSQSFLLLSVALLLFSVNVWAESVSGLRTDKLIDPEKITDVFEQGEPTTKVIVNLVRPSKILAQTKWDSRRSVETLHTEIRSRQQDVLSVLSGEEFQLRHLFDNQAGFSVEITESGLQKLLDNPMVESIEPVLILEAHLAQGIELINGLEYRSAYNGQGIAIAICDTGIDCNHPRLGNGGFPNSKVIGGYDFGDDDSDPTPNSQAHGTCCAGIAAGDLGATGDYIGGVAYNAKLYALKISYGNTGYAYSDAMVAAWDWCVTHKDDDPCNPIMVISTSFGGGRYFSSCDSYIPSMTTAANNAVAAGITVLASSGNDGYCDSMGWPACISSVISVGAVYDADFGIYQPCVSAASCATKYYTETGCSSNYYAIDDTSADMVTSYSNTASFLGVLAPSNQAYTTDISGFDGYSSGDYYSSFGGTSAACPYAAGAVASLQAAAKAIIGDYLSPVDVMDKLTFSGDSITDGKVDITRPRVNLGRAIAYLTGSPPVAENDSILAESGVATAISLQASDDGLPDPPGMLTYIIESLPSYGTLSDPCEGVIVGSNLPYALADNGNEVIYASLSCYVGPDEFEFKVNDGGVEPNGGDSNTATVSIEVTTESIVVFETDFEQGLPDGWSIIDGFDDEKTWMSENPENRTSPGGMWTELFMLVDSDWAGRRVDMNEQLITQTLDCSNLSDVKLKFKHYFRYYVLGEDEIGDVDVRVDFGQWQNVARYEGTSFEGPVELDISSIADDQNNVQIRWHYYDANWDWYWGIDDVQIEAKIAFEKIAGDFELDCDVDFVDFGMFATAWLSVEGDDNWDWIYDISEPNDGMIDFGDLNILMDNWLVGK